jgi:hypothetical protein
MIGCAKCGFENSDDANFCSRCGNRLVPSDAAHTTAVLESVAECEPHDQEYETVYPREAPMLIIRAGGGREGEEIPLTDEPLTIGRTPESGLFLDDVTVSRHHARIMRDATGLLVEDQNSLNGTYVNRTRVERQRLKDGDELQIGKFKLVFLEQAQS